MARLGVARVALAASDQRFGPHAGERVERSAALCGQAQEREHRVRGIGVQSTRGRALGARAGLFFAGVLDLVGPARVRGPQVRAQGQPGARELIAPGRRMTGSIAHEKRDCADD